MAEELGALYRSVRAFLCNSIGVPLCNSIGVPIYNRLGALYRSDRHYFWWTTLAWSGVFALSAALALGAWRRFGEWDSLQVTFVVIALLALAFAVASFVQFLRCTSIPEKL